MDTSETYIKMCEKAGEIQGEWKMSEWDYAYCRGCAAAIKESPWKDESAVIVLSGYETDGGYYGHEAEPGVECSCPVSNGAFRHGDRVFRDEHFWLPRQDQLQAMLPNFFNAATSYVHEIVRHIVDFYKCNDFSSWEQLWLVFVYKEKYNKVWNGDDWVGV